MTGRHLFWILLTLLGSLLVWQIRQARDVWRANHILNQVEFTTMQLNEHGKRLPPQMGKVHLRLLRQVVKLNPALVDAHVASSWQYLLLGKPRGAIRVLEKALALEPRGRIYANLGEAYLKAEERPKAREAFERAILLDPRLRRELRSQLSQVKAP